MLVSDSGRSVPFDFSVEDEGPERICDIRLIASFYELGRSRWQKHGHLRKRCPGDDQPDGRESAGTDSGVYHRRGDTLVFELQDEGKFIELGDRGVLRGDTLRTAFRGAVDRQPVSVYVRRRRGAQ